MQAHSHDPPLLTVAQFVNTTGSSLHHTSGSGWQLLGELELPAGSSVTATIHAQLEGLLQPLPLGSDLLERLLSSAQNAAGRNNTSPGHIHLIVFGPAEVTATAGNWGFFRIERMENGSNSSAPDHAIEFYLYCE